MWCSNVECSNARGSGVPVEAGEGAGTCPTCGATLVGTRPDRPHRPEDDLVALPTITLSHDSLLPVLKAMLDASGVRYFVKDEGVQDLIGFGGRLVTDYNPVTGAPVLVVDPEDLEAAQEILREVEEAHRTAPKEMPDETEARAEASSRRDYP